MRDLYLNRCLVYDNESEDAGGGFFCLNALNINVEKCTIIDNKNERDYATAFCISHDTGLTLHNSIVYFNAGRSIGKSGSCYRDTIRVSYCDFMGGQDSIYIGAYRNRIQWGEGNLDEDPLFMGEGEREFYLDLDSPCLNAGDPDSPQDPDGSRIDIGVFPLCNIGLIRGKVYELSTRKPISGAEIRTSYGDIALTDEEGRWSFPFSYAGEYSLTVTHKFYNQRTYHGLNREVGDTLDVDLRMRQGELELDRHDLTIGAEPGGTGRSQLIIRNVGNGRMHWSAHTQTEGELAGFEPWSNRGSIPAADITGDYSLHGVVFTGEYYVIAGSLPTDRNRNREMVYILNRDLEMVRRFIQPGEGILGFRDLAWDGELVWGSGERRVFGFDLEGNVIYEWEGPFHNNRHLAWDCDREILWIATNDEDYIAGFKRDGCEIDRIQPAPVVSAYGLGYHRNEKNRNSLHLFHRIDDDRNAITSINPDSPNRDYSIRSFDFDFRPEGLFFTGEYDPRSISAMFISKSQDDIIQIWHIESLPSWLSVEPRNGIIGAGQEQEVSVVVDARALDCGEFGGIISFECENQANISFVNVAANVRLNSAGDISGNLVDFKLNSIRPNPFNSTTRIEFQLPAAKEVSLEIYDCSGRLVDVIANGRFDAGTNSVSWNATGHPAGLYFCKLSAGSFMETRRVILMN